MALHTMAQRFFVMPSLPNTFFFPSAERDPLHQGLIVQRAQLKSRDFQLDLTSRLGKTQVITLNTPLNQQVCQQQLLPVKKQKSWGGVGGLGGGAGLKDSHCL